MLALSACNGIFEGIYDEPEADAASDFGFVNTPSGDEPGVIYIDATDYTLWHYIDFESMEVTALPTDAEAPAQWDVAIHRYDAKTNGGAVCETGATSFYSLRNFVKPGAEAYVEDVWTTSTIVTDMSTMADGYLGYAESYYNAELSRWLDVDKSQMPPIYTPSNKVYMLRMADGREAALRLDNFMDASGVKGFMTIQYIYPYK